MNRLCSIDNCGRKHYGKDLCRSHYDESFRPRRITNGGTAATCEQCGDGFQQSKAGVRYCSRQCIVRAYEQRHGARNLYLRKQFNISAEQWDSLFESQGNACAICKATESGGQGWAVDHDHACCPERGRSCGECIRGILCFGCNTALGKWNDDPETIRAALAYVTRRLVVG